MYLGDLRISQVKRILLYCMKYFPECVLCSKQETRATGVKFTHLLQCHNSLWKMWLKNDILPQVCCRTDVSPNNQNVKSSLMWWRVAGTWSNGKVSQIIEGFHNRFFFILFWHGGIARGYSKEKRNPCLYSCFKWLQILLHNCLEPKTERSGEKRQQ